MAINKVIFGGETLIDLTSDTVDAAHLLSGYKAHDRSGTIITGTCAYDADTSDANASADEILATKTAYVGGSKVTGTMPNNGAVTGTITTKAGQYTFRSVSTMVQVRYRSVLQSRRRLSPAISNLVYRF